MKKIALSLATIAAMLTMTVAATGAYFSDARLVSGNTFSTGTVTLNKSWLAPIAITGLYPGAEKTATFNVQYTGSVKGDLYFGFQHASGGAVLGQDLSFAVEQTDGNGHSLGYVTGWVTADFPYQNWIKIASGLNQNDPVYYTVHVKMTDTGVAQNTEQGQTALADIVLYAVQQGVPAPTTWPMYFTDINNS
jgi:hypothetical protein